ncbi:hypothetical protein IKE_05994 [Bacillus cereus VD196]|uniref:Uncharacterized protein n=1 Tax=Bacillus cereus VD196 TaxID=1053243 RepID=A0A9W5PY70_BACCE|nr:hypothetical protein IKE_05994 [Bacillus cereus VD196]
MFIINFVLNIIKYNKVNIIRIYFVKNDLSFYL